MLKFWPNRLGKEGSHIVLYGIAMAILILALKWLQWKYLVVDNANDIYIGLIAVLFTLLGIWVATQLIQPKTETVIIEKEVIIHQSDNFTVNQVELDKLHLTKREYQILQLLAEGHTNADIAAQLFLSLSTIKTHVSNLYAKMKVKNRIQAITWAKSKSIVK